MNKIIVMLALILGLATVNSAHAEFLWRHFGAAPYARSLQEACEKAPTAIDGSSMPEAVKRHFKRALGDCKGGAVVWLTPNESLEQMWSGPDKGHAKDWVMNRVTVAELPVLHSPGGRFYRKGAVAEAAKALSWAFVYEGKTYVLVLPLECFNWSWRAFIPTVPVEECSTVQYTVKPGDEVHFAVLAKKRLPASACWQLQDGAEKSALPSPCDSCDWIDPRSLIPKEFEPLHTGRYVAHAAHQSLRFPREIEGNYVVICVTRSGRGESDSWIVQPSAWKGKVPPAIIRIPYGNQKWPVWGANAIDWSEWPTKHAD